MTIQTYKMGRSRLSLGEGISLFSRMSGGSHKYSVRVFAILAVVLMLLSCITVLYSADSNDADFTDDDYYVVYEPGTTGDLFTGNNGEPDSTGYQSLEVKYDGYAVAEYNPQFWKTSSGSQWSDSISEHATPLSDVENWYPISGYVSVQENPSAPTMVFTGWRISGDGPKVDPGTDLRSEEYSEYWTGNEITLVAQWDTLYDIVYVDGDNDDDNNRLFHNDDGTKSEPTSLSEGLDGIDEADIDSKYRSIVLLYFNSNESRNIGASDIDKSVTIRSYIGDGNNSAIKTISFSGAWDASREIIIDNVGFQGPNTSSDSHGSNRYGLYAGGNKLILGTGISSNSVGTQVSGGSSGSSVESSELVLFSGTYSNVIGGSSVTYSEGWIWPEYYAYSVTDTSVTILGGMVTDSVYGGNGVLFEEGSYSDYQEDLQVSTTTVLVAGGKVWDGASHDAISGTYQTIVGGSRLGDVATSNTIITGKAKVFAVQGGGRSGSTSSVETANLTISGDACIVYMACGSVTDGNDSEGRAAPVGTTNVTIRGSATVGTADHNGSVYAGGWDTYTNSLGPSTNSTHLSISDACEIFGSVYGGGFRGTIGTERTGQTVTIEMTGGTIHGSLYGGGKGGADPISTGHNNSTGRAYINGDVSITVADGTVDGYVYGGGEGASRLPGDSGGNNGGVDDSAKVTGNVSIAIGEGATVGGVFGGGKGDISDPRIASVKGNVEMTVHGTVSEGDVFGGGQYASLTGDVDMTIDGATVGGDVYGGGMNASVTAASTELIIDGSSIGGSVYGGGMYGLQTSRTVGMTLGGMDTAIGGSVYGGGLGQEGRLATVVDTRDIVINGPTIGGNVYGGSRYGDDNFGNDYGTCETNIYILSGNIASGSSGNVYGGGYKGRSKMDVLIQVGSAVPESVDEPAYRGFAIDSIYGGASVGDVTTGSTLLNQQLLFGNVTMEVGGYGRDDCSISGDVFGAGDYCDISGTSEITFEDFSQIGSMLSIQKADSVTLVNSELVLEGNVDGNSTSGSAKFSINDVGKLTLESNQSGRSGITMDAQVSSLSAYESLNGRTIVEDNEYVTAEMNYLRMNGGKMFSVLGEDNDGTKADGESPDTSPMDWIATSGVTLFLGDLNTYYGAFAISGPNVDDTTRFILSDGSEAARTSYEYIDGVTVTVWYHAGAFTVDETLTISSDLRRDSADISIPKMTSGSEIRYVGHYVSMDSEDSLNLVGTLTGNPGKDFTAILGSGEEDDGNIHFNGYEGINLADPGENTSSTESGARIRIDVATQTGFTTTGYAGTIHIHMVEVRGSIVIGTFDIEVSVYLNMEDADHDVGIDKNILVKEIEGGRHQGSTDVYLPVIAGTADYMLVSVSGLDLGAELEMTLASTNLNKSGWLTNLGDMFSLGTVDLSGGRTEYLGLGGMYPPVLHFEFTCGGHEDSDEEESWDPIIITLTVVPEGSSEGYEYTITLTPKLADQRTVLFYDMWLETEDGDVRWGYPEDDQGGRVPIFSLQVDFGDSMMGVYVLIDTSKLTLTWDEQKDLRANMTGFMSKFAEALEKVTDEEGNTLVKTGTMTEMEALRDGKAEGKWAVLPVYSNSEDLLDLYQERKADFIKTQYDSDADSGFRQDFAYLSNVRWFDNPEGPAQFNFYSQITEDDLSIYAGYGVIITFAPYAEMTIAGQVLWTNPSSMFYGDLETAVDFEKLKGSLQVTTGYSIHEFQYLVNGEWTAVPKDHLLLQDVTIRVVLVPEEYSITVSVSVEDEDGTIIEYGGDFEVEHSSDGSNYETLGPGEKLHYGDSVRIVIEYEGTKYRILSVTGTYGISTMNTDRFTLTQGEENVSSTAAFVMPNGDLTVELVLSKGYTLTIGLADPEGNDNDKFGLIHTGEAISAVTSGGSGSVELQIGLSQTWTGTISATYVDDHAIEISIVGEDASRVSFSDGTLTITDIDEDLEIEVVLMIGWTIEFDGSFTVTDEGNNPVSDGGTVHTGDTLTVTANPGYIFTESPTVTNGDLRGWDVGASEFHVDVTGEGDVRIEATAELHSFTVTVTLEFLSSGTPGDVTVTVVSGGVTSEAVKGEGWTYTALVDAGAEFTVTASADGYIFTEGAGRSAEGAAVTVYGAEETRGESGTSAEGTLTIATYSGSINGTYAVSGEMTLTQGTFVLGAGTVTVGGSSVTLEGFPRFVGTMVLGSPLMGTLTVISYPSTEGM